MLFLQVIYDQLLTLSTLIHKKTIPFCRKEYIQEKFLEIIIFIAFNKIRHIFNFIQFAINSISELMGFWLGNFIFRRNVYSTRS